MIEGTSVHAARPPQDISSGDAAGTQPSHCSQAYVLLSDQTSSSPDRTGKTEVYSVFPGIDAAYHLLYAQEIAVHHAASPHVLELFYCRSGRVGWNMRGGTAVYLGAGDLTAHSAECCADSAIMLPLGYAEGISISADLQVLQTECPEILREAALDLSTLKAAFCSGGPVSFPACPSLEGIFLPLYSAPPSRRRAYLQLKVQELLLCLADTPPEKRVLTQYVSRQTELVREIHRQLTEHLERRFTIEQLSRQYLMNTSTLKEVFKAVYGLPIATYMKEYRMARAMQLLRETRLPISEIAAQVGYETQGKFSQAFKNVVQMPPREYRQIHGSDPSN